MEKIFLFFFPIFILAQEQEKKEELSNFTPTNKTLTSFNQSKSPFDYDDKSFILEQNDASIKPKNVKLNLSDAGKTISFLGTKNDTSYSLYNDPGAVNFSENMKNTHTYSLYDSRPLKYLNNYLDKHNDK